MAILTQDEMEEIAAKGEAVFVESVAAQVAGRNLRDHVCIDVDSGDYEVDANAVVASRTLKARRPHGRLWGRLVGSPVALRFGRIV